MTMIGNNISQQKLHARMLRCGASLAAFAASLAIAGAPAQAQLVSACTGVSLPRSVVTDIVRDPLLGITAPIQGTVNNILGVVGIIPIVGQVFPPLSIDVNGLLATAASGAPITLSALDTNGNIIGPSDQCNTTADSFTLDTPAGIAIGGNQITGLGATGQAATAGEIGSIAFGNSASTTAAATNAVAIGSNASVTAANGVALGAGSVADRAANPSYAAFGLAAPQASAGSVSVGAPGAERQITNVAAGSAPTDAVNVAQLAAVSTTVANAVQYDVDGGGNRLNNIALAGGAAGPVTITNLADGSVAAGSSDAVTGNQLFATNSQVTTNTTNIAANSTSITNLLNGTAGLVQQAGGAPGAGTIGIGAATGGLAITVAGTDGDRVVSGIANGTLAAGSSDAVNGGQLFATNNQVATNTTNIATNTSNIATNATAITNLSAGIDAGTLGLVQQAGGAPGAGLISVGAATGGTTISVAGTDGNRVVSGVAAGVAATDAVNVGQLTAVSTAAANGVQYDLDGGGNRLNSVTLAGGVAGPVTITNLADGNVAAGSSDAVTGNQLFATNSQVTTNTTNIATNTANILTNTTNITGLLNGTAGLVQQIGGAPGAGIISVGAATGGTNVNFAGSDGNRVLSGVAAGVAATDAVNVGQLTAVSTAAANGVQYDLDGGGNRLNSVTLAGGTAGPVAVTNLADGTVAAGSSDAVTGSQLFATNSQVTTNTTNISSILNGTAGLVLQAGGSPGIGLISIGAATGGTTISVAGTDGNRVVSGVAAGVAATDAVNVGQLAAVSTAAANAVQYDLDGGGNRLNSVTLSGGTAGPVTITNLADGTVAAGSTEAVTGSQLFATNSQVATNTTNIATNTANIANNTTAITQLADGIDNGTRGLVQQTGGSPGSGAISVGATTGGTVINVAGTNGNRVLSGLANGVAGSDAVTVAQLNGLTGGALNAVLYDDDGNGGRSNRITLSGGSAGTVRITNLADGTIAAGSTDAVTGSQLAATNTNLANTNIVVSQTSTTVNAIVQGQAGAFRSDNTAGAAAPAATGANATAGGFGAAARAAQSVALGNGALSTGINSVALGSGSSDGGEANVVSVGSSSQLRRLTNVGPAINGTDAINLSQLQTATTQFQGSINNLQGQISGLQGQLNSLRFDVRSLQRRANAGAAGAIALAGLPQAFVAGKGMIAAAVGEFEGEVAFAFGLSKVIGNQTVVRAGSTFTSRGPKGFNAGVGYQF